ncbi:MAG TPA: cell division protein SepF [Acidimicrobiia bacterium]|jgi:cell division inhibitor SepF
MASLWRRTLVYLGLQDDDEYPEYDDYYDEAAPEPAVSRVQTQTQPRVADPGIAVSSGATVRPLPRADEPAVVPSPKPPVIRPMPANHAARVHVVEPHGFNDAQEVGDRLKANQPVIVNLQGLGKDLQRRLIDFSSGLAYAVGGTMSRVADQVFLLTPADVEVSQEEKERLQAKGLYRT